MRKILILGAMPSAATPEVFLAAGPWCFCGREESFPEWSVKFQFGNEPLQDGSLLPRAAAQAQALAMAAIPDVAASICRTCRNYPDIYWQTLLGPWIISAASLIVERWLRVKAMVNQWGHLDLEVALLPKTQIFNFANENDFNKNGALGLTYNWWLFSRLFEERWPENWRKYYEKPNSPAVCKQSGSKFKTILKKLILRLPFPPLKGMGLFESLLFSAALLHQTRVPAAESRSELFSNPQIIADLPQKEALLPIFLASLPESIKNLKHGSAIKKLSKTTLKIASISAYENAPYRLRLSRWKAAGGRLAFAQHGSNYGQAKIVCDSAFVEYAEDLFFTWGWRKHGKARGNFLPMPSPGLERIKNSWHAETEAIIFVGTEMACYSYRLESRPTPLQFLKYRQDKAAFLAALSPETRRRLLYRPYFSIPGTLSDAEWLKARFPEIDICKGKLFKQIKSCALLALDHPGTTLLEAFAANIPTILYWNKDFWPWTPEAEHLLNGLAESGIWHKTPEKAAGKLEEILDAPHVWWFSENVQKAIADFCACQARTIKHGFLNFWTSTLRKL